MLYTKWVTIHQYHMLKILRDAWICACLMSAHYYQMTGSDLIQWARQEMKWQRSKIKMRNEDCRLSPMKRIHCWIQNWQRGRRISFCAGKAKLKQGKTAWEISVNILIVRHLFRKPDFTQIIYVVYDKWCHVGWSKEGDKDLLNRVHFNGKMSLSQLETNTTGH